MDNAPQRALRCFASDLVNNYGEYDADSKSYYVSLHCLPLYIQSQFAALCLEVDDRDTSGCFADESVCALDDPITSQLVSFLKTNNTIDSYDLARAIRRQTIKRYATYMQEQLDEAASDYTDNFHSESNRVPHVVGQDVQLRRAL